MVPRTLKAKLIPGLAPIAILAVAGMAAAALVLAGAARAGEYHLYSCRTPSGQVAPTEGWSFSRTGGYDVSPSSTCESGGGLVAALKAGVTHSADTDVASWAFDAPAGETIAAATLWRAGDTAGGATEGGAFYMFSLTNGANIGPKTNVIEECQATGCPSHGSLNNPFAPENRVVVPENALTSPLYANASCGAYTLGPECPADKGDPNGYAAMIELFAADLVLDQPEGPSVSSVEGGLADFSTVGGTSDVAFAASDPGSGVYEAVFRVDGQVVSSTVLDEAGGRCRDVGQTADGLPAFLYPQPCPASLSVDVPFDTTGLSNGPHHLVVSVLDAAGNAATVLDREIAVANPTSPGSGTGAARGPANGLDASEHAILTARWRNAARDHLSGGYGAARTIEGRLTGPEGRGIADAQVEADVLPAYTGSHARALAPVRTSADGRWRMDLPRDIPSCALRMAYRSHLGDALPAATRTLTLSVRAALVLRIAPRATASEGSIFFSGRLLGGPLPAGGKQLVLEASSPGGRWIEFHVIRTAGRGRFRYSYRFRLPGPALYSFRVRSESEADFPFAAGVSNVVRVFER